MLGGMTERTGRATDPAAAGRAAARWAVLCALLLGLFLMHGSPASATGCHPAPSASAPPSAPLPLPPPASASPPASHAATGHTRPGEGRPSINAPMRKGSSAAACVSTQARDRAPVPAPGAALPPHPPLLPLTGPGPVGAERGGRAPPDGGRELLIRVCVARR
ncbi:hypothetical protein EDD38_1778 [Kitasatospora cineracea]|uniref:Uncharacterized protein n=2 Tax=Kitasatospora cineracea TaxID=88074 RepID=A0A3N4RJD7_9ACTN|nr:hypothetical protein EDD38_1778 [Kitasatospora cineracea]